MMEEQNVDRTQRANPIVLPSMNSTEVPGMAAEMAPKMPMEQEVPAEDPMMEEEPVMEDDFEEADDLDIEKEDTCPECGEDEENCECEDEDEEEKLMASLANNRILKRILASKRK